MLALDAEGRVQAELIRAAARRGGVLTREEVYEIAGFPPDRTLRGLTRPTRRITGGLIDAGVLGEDAAYPFQAEYVTGVLATHFSVPADVVDALHALGRPVGV
jgi:hypothetical protein